MSPARRPRCGVPRLRATRGGRHWVEGVACGPAAFGVSLAVPSVVPSGRLLSRPAAVPGLRRPPHGVALRGAPHSTTDAPPRGVDARRVHRSDLGGFVRLHTREAPGRTAVCLAQRASGGGRARRASAAGRDANGRKARRRNFCHCQPESCVPVGKVSGRMTPAAMSAKSRYAGGRPGVGGDATTRAQRWHSPPSSALVFRPAFCRIWQATCLYTFGHLPR